MQALIWERNHVWGSSFFSEYSKLYADYDNAEKDGENIFWFWDNCIWIGCVRHSLLLR